MNSKEHWNNVYQNNSPFEVSWYQGKPSISLSIIETLGLKKDDAIIDVGGGASTLVDYLLKGGFEKISVLDLSSCALELAKERLQKKSRSVSWYAEDVTSFVSNTLYSFWHDRAVFHFLTKHSDRQKYKQILEATVKEGGYVVIAAFAKGGPTQCSGLDIVQYDAETLKKELGPAFKLIDEQTEQHTTPSGKVQLFGYFVFVKESHESL